MLRRLSSPVRIFGACFHGGTKSWERDLCCESETECCPIKKADSIGLVHTLYWREEER